MDLGGQGVAALDDAEEPFFSLPQLIDLASKVLEDLVEAIDADESCDVVEGRVISEQVRVWRREELPIGICERHGREN